MIIHNFVTTYKEAQKYRILDRSPNWAAKSSGQVYQKRVKLYHKADTKHYYLPPKEQVVSGLPIPNPSISFTGELFKPWELQLKMIDFVEDFFRGRKGYSILIDSQVGSGKSKMSLGITHRFKVPTIITVPSIAIGEGMLATYAPHFNTAFLTASKIKDRIKSDSLPDVLICHRQSAVNCWDELMSLNKYQLLINDEQHHLSAGMIKLCNTFNGSIGIVGLTGTPFRKEITKEDFLNYFNYIYETGIESLPVRVITHRFKYNYSLAEFIKASEGLDPESPEVMRRLFINNSSRTEELRKVVRSLYYDLGFRRLMIFVDRREQMKAVKEIFSKAYEIHGDSDKEAVIASLKGLDEFLLIGMVQASGEGFDVPHIQCGILFYSTSRAGSLIQMVGRSKRFSGNKTHAYWVDFQDYGKIEPAEYVKSFGANLRLKHYKDEGYEILGTLDQVARGLPLKT